MKDWAPYIHALQGSLKLLPKIPGVYFRGFGGMVGMLDILASEKM